MMEGPLHLLLADDEEIVHLTIGDYLRESGYRVDEARDGVSALKAIEANGYDLALIDIRMPGMDGFSLLARAREVRPEMKMVVITGHGDMDMSDHALRLGASGFLTKPLRLLELDEVLDKAIRGC